MFLFILIIQVKAQVCPLSSLSASGGRFRTLKLGIPSQLFYPFATATGQDKGYLVIDVFVYL
jgi:hypothetical protein